MRARPLIWLLFVALVGCADGQLDPSDDPYQLAEPGRDAGVMPDLGFLDMPDPLDLAPELDMAPDLEPGLDMAPDLEEPQDLGPDLEEEPDLALDQAPDLAPGAPYFTTEPPATATEWVPVRYEVGCEDPDGQSVTLRGAGDDTCGGGRFSGSTYVWTPGEEHGGKSCTLHILCSDGEHVVEQLATIEVAEVNDAPRIMEVILLPSPVAAYGDPISCQYTYTDGEDDPDQSLIEWLINGQVVATGRVLTSYPVGATVRCRVTPSDGMRSGPSQTSAPRRVPDQLLVAAGDAHTCAIRNGGLYCWGEGQAGRLGSGAETDQRTPHAVPTMSAQVSALDTGYAHTCAVKAGALYCWGNNYAGQLGDGTRTQRATPQPVVGMSSGVTSVVLGGQTCAIKAGALYCWGGDVLTPSLVPGMSSGVSAVAAGGEHTCAIQAGALYCWGGNYGGQIGDGTIMSAQLPYMVGAADSVSAGGMHTCAIHAGALSCWGSNSEWQIGSGNMSRAVYRPASVLGMSAGVEAVLAGAAHTCAIKAGALYCWGFNAGGQVGDNTVTGQRLTPTPVHDMAAHVISGAAGSSHTCAVRDGAIWCWGDNASGQLGDGTAQRRYVPTRVTFGP